MAVTTIAELETDKRAIFSYLMQRVSPSRSSMVNYFLALFYPSREGDVIRNSNYHLEVNHMKQQDKH
jgi:hypothetical protein